MTLNTRIHLSRLKTETFNCRCFNFTPNLSEMDTLKTGGWYGLLVICLISIVLQDMYYCVLDSVQ